VALILAVLTLVGCGGDERPADAAVTIENKLGDVRIGERPVRVVALDFPSADDAIALGVVPVEGEDGRAKISPERLETIDADVIMGTSPTPDALDELVPRLAEAVE
jgi:ABC-type Fe3+-citrate transport system substrate-binding protein